MNKFCLLALVALGGCLISGGCYSGEDDSHLVSFQKKIEQDIKKSHDPNLAIPKIRKYALEKLHDLTDDEADFIEDNKPIINSNYDDTEFSFVWKLKKHYLIEVVTMPGPFIPIAVYRTRRTIYP